VSYSYNAIGNLTSYAGSAYSYGSSQPHAVTVAYGSSYSYGYYPYRSKRSGAAFNSRLPIIDGIWSRRPDPIYWLSAVVGRAQSVAVSPLLVDYR
jgi:hypothetical protein